jgi:nitroimidazol reductase NimA-like FMN-containing flavoprotein (pyridoxamine 5'-phosphate oxidase superfamily)
MPPTDHAGLEVLTYDECVERLEHSQVGRLAFLSDGDVQIFPVNYRWHDGAVVFRTAPGTKLDAAFFKKVAAFEIDGWDSVFQTGWSVVAKGLVKRSTRLRRWRSSTSETLGRLGTRRLGANSSRRGHRPQDHLIFGPAFGWRAAIG